MAASAPATWNRKSARRCSVWVNDRGNDGANDMGWVILEENVVSQVGTTYRLNESEVRRRITEAGRKPRQCDQYYDPIDPPRRRGPLPVTV